MRTVAQARRIPTIDAGAPVGPRGVKFLHRVRGAGGAYRLCSNADREALDRALLAGFVRHDVIDRECVHLTEAGAAYLDRMMRVW